MKFFNLLLILFFLTFNLNQVKAEVIEEEVEMILGIDKILKFDFAPYTKLSIGNSKILNYDIYPQKREVTLRPMAPGVTSVTVRDTKGEIRSRYKVNISTNSNAQLISDLRAYLDDVEGLEIGMKGNKVYLGGEIVVPSDVGIIDAVMEKYNTRDVLVLYELSPITQEIIAGKVREEFNNKGLNNVSIRIVNKTFWLEGVVDSEAKRALAMTIAEGFLPDSVRSLGGQRLQRVKGRSIIQNFISITPAKQRPKPPPRMIKVTAQFVELQKDYNKVFGFKWIPAINTGGGAIAFGKTTTDGVTTNSSETFSGTISNLIPKLASAKSAGYARIIQSGMVIVEEFKKANINKQTTNKISLGSGEFQKTEDITAGFVLNVAPKVIGKDQVEMDLDVKVNQVSGASGTTNNSIKTILMVKTRETAVIGGVSVNENRTDFDKDPPFGQDQFQSGGPLFSFLRSKNQSITKSQFVVFVTPEIIQSATATTEEVRRKFRRRR